MYSRQAVGLILKTRCSQFGSVFSRLQTTKSPTKDHRDIVPFGTPSQGVDVVPAGSWAKFATFQRSNGSDVAHFQDVVRTGSWSVRDARPTNGRCPESNPLRSGCSRLPCRLAPASCQCPRQESNLVLDLRRVACESSTLQGHVVCQYLTRESNPVLRFRRPPCVHHTRKACCRVARPGIEPGPTASEAVMRSSTLTSQIQKVSQPGIEPGPRP